MIPNTNSFITETVSSDFEPGTNDIIMEADNGERVVFTYNPRTDATTWTNTYPSPTLEEINSSMEFGVEAASCIRHLAEEFSLSLETVEGLWTACDGLDYDSDYISEVFWAWNELICRSTFFKALEISLIGDDTQFIEANVEVRIPKFYLNDNSDLGTFYLTVHLDTERNFNNGDRSFAEVRYETLRWLIQLELDCRKMRDGINDMINGTIKVQDRREDMYYFN